MTDLAELRRLAEAAEPGKPWYAKLDRITRAESEYIAALSPDVVLELLDRLERAEAERYEWERRAETNLDRYETAIASAAAMRAERDALAVELNEERQHRRVASGDVALLRAVVEALEDK